VILRFFHMHFLTGFQECRQGIAAMQMLL
jgi:hypothetical protein